MFEEEQEGDDVVITRFDLLLKRVGWRVAPRRESIKDPTKPEKAPAAIIRRASLVSRIRLDERHAVKLIIKPPARDATKPRIETPPLTPGATRFHVRILTGAD